MPPPSPHSLHTYALFACFAISQICTPIKKDIFLKFWLYFYSYAKNSTILVYIANVEYIFGR